MAESADRPSGDRPPEDLPTGPAWRAAGASPPPDPVYAPPEPMEHYLGELEERLGRAAAEQGPRGLVRRLRRILRRPQG